jgi:SAM-dependent methyltransferase
MMKAILDWMRAARQRYPHEDGWLLEVGSKDINGSPRVIFPDADPYVGMDIEHGPGVDLVFDAERLRNLPFSQWADTVVCCETLEHVVRPWLVVEGLRRALRPGGHLWISSPAYGFPLHRFPVDCYRFGEDAYRLWIFQGMDILDLAEVRDELGQPAIVAVARSRS